MRRHAVTEATEFLDGRAVVGREAHGHGLMSERIVGA
jgi:hypothetical protein